MCRKCSICPAQTFLSLFALLLATFLFSLLAAKGHISMKINFILGPVGPEVSANLCQEIQNDGKEEVSVFLYCPVFLIMEHREDLDTGSIFLP